MDTPPAITLRREPGPLTRSLVALLLRLGLGLLFLMVGLAKFHQMREGTYPATIIRMFEKTNLRGVPQFAAALPYAEVGLGIALMLGLLTPLTASLAGVLLLQLLFGQLVLGDPKAFPNMMIYLLFDAGILWLSPVTSNYISLDGLLFGWFWKPRNQLDYVREDIQTRF